MSMTPSERSHDAIGLPDALMWVKDAPLFIDATNLDSFYDAVVRPAFRETAPRQISVSDELKRSLEGKGAASASIHLPSWLSGILDGGAKVEASATAGRGETSGTKTVIELEAIKTPQRQLEQLAVFYLLERNDRLLFGTKESPIQWQADHSADKLPRAMAFIDLPQGSKLIPMAAEFMNGHIVTFFDKLRATDGQYPPKYDAQSKAAYWKWFSDHFDAQQAIDVIEGAAATEGAKIEWIDFRVALNEHGETLHLHIQTSGRYSTGTFAYQFVRRCLGHGIRLVGTLKNGPDLNVLAVYEK